MRQYRYPATEATVDALRRLRAPWRGYLLGDAALVVALADGRAVRIRVEGAVVEPSFEAYRLSAEPADLPPEPLTPPGAFGDGRNDLVVFRSETWIDAPGAASLDGAGPDAVVQFTGASHQRPASATAVCEVDDALVVATGAGTGLLVRCGLRPYTLDATTEATAIARFLAERRYGAGDADG